MFKQPPVASFSHRQRGAPRLATYGSVVVLRRAHERTTPFGRQRNSDSATACQSTSRKLIFAYDDNRRGHL
jgi:hypothetical protein